MKRFPIKHLTACVYFRLVLLLFFLSILTQAGGAQEKRDYVPEVDSAALRKLTQWQSLKFGLLMHWGPYSQWGVVESWSICSEDEPWCRRRSGDYTEYKKSYEGLKLTFDPVRFNPQKWASAARAAGMRYVVFTTKHHDGFCMWDTKLTDYKITDTACAYGRRGGADVTRGIFEAFRSEGFLLGAYFSKPDWHSENYWWPNFATPDRNPNYDLRRYPERWQKFVEYTHGQIGELLSGYGTVDILWLDGGWVRARSEQEIRALLSAPDYKFERVQNQDIDMPRLAREARKLQPGILIVDRDVPGPYQNYLTPEARVPEATLPYPWETCMPMATSWSFVPKDTYKPTRELVHMLVDVVSKGGNLLLNIGPGPDGELDPEAYERLREMGDWMRVNGEAIYGSRPLPPYASGRVRWLASPRKGECFLVILAAPGEDGKPPNEVLLPSSILKDPATVDMLGAGPLSFTPGEAGTLVTIPEKIRRSPPCRFAWTLRITEQR